MENNEVKFDEPEYRAPRLQVTHNSFIDFLIKKGLAKDEQQAMYILFGVIGISVLVSLWFFRGNTPQVPIDSATGEEIIEGKIPGQI